MDTQEPENKGFQAHLTLPGKAAAFGRTSRGLVQIMWRSPEAGIRVDAGTRHVEVRHFPGFLRKLMMSENRETGLPDWTMTR